MAREDVAVARLEPQVRAGKLNHLINWEAGKGCLPWLSRNLVELEPPYTSFEDISALLKRGEPAGVIDVQTPPAAHEIARFQVWVERDQACDWMRSELFLKQLQLVNHRITYEIIGNEESIVISFACHTSDIPVLRTAFLGAFPDCTLSTLSTYPLDDVHPDAWKNIVFVDYFPPPPYSHLLTRSNELHISPHESLIRALAEVPASTTGVYQVVLQPVAPSHNWHANAKFLIDLEYEAKLRSEILPSHRNPQQVPSGDLRGMSLDVDTKSHNDKPFYAAAVRIAVLEAVPDPNRSILRALSTFMSLFQHGGRPLEFLTEKEYLAELEPDRIQALFTLGTTHRPGILLNSAELTGFVHVPALTTAKYTGIPVEVLDGPTILRALPTQGTHLGSASIAGTNKDIYIPPHLQCGHAHIIGRPGMGKSCLIEHMCLDDITKGHGVIVIDPHGDLAERIISLIPEAHIGRTIYFNPGGNPNKIPKWNPLHRQPGQDAGRTAADIVAAIRASTTGWGDRLGHLLLNASYGVLCLDDGTMLDVYCLLTADFDRSEPLRHKICDAVDNDVVRRFFLNDIMNYKKDDFAPAHHKLTKLLSSPVYLMLAQPDSTINLQQIMDEGFILIADLSNAGDDATDLLGSLFLSLVDIHAVQRSKIPRDKRRRFCVYADEAHRFITTRVEDLIAETRKFNVSLTLAHQYISQFGDRGTVDALNMTATTVAFNLLQDDAERLSIILGNGVQTQDLTSLGMGEAMVRVGDITARTNTPLPLPVTDPSIRERIINNSYSRYYTNAEEIIPTVRVRLGLSESVIPIQEPSPLLPADPEQEFKYAVL